MTRGFVQSLLTASAPERRAGEKRVSEVPSRCLVGKVGISVVTMTQTLELLAQRADEGRPAYVCVTNVHATVLSQKDPGFCRIQNESFLAVPDGMPLIWYARMMGERNIERVCGPDLMAEILRISQQRRYTHYFYGDTDDTLRKMRQVIDERFPGTPIVGMHSPPFRSLTDEELDATVDEINRLRPSFVWLGLGCPKQERWIGRVFPRIESSILIGVGAAFRFLAGEYRHPPRVLQVCGLEGIFWRVLHRPGYVIKWYAYHVPAFGCLFLRGLAKRIRGEVGRA
jgi:N-acetylglucosaminyldiphosphoundecaprenol N-acetyl-beta-D-mannosaminyltransferase